MEDVPTEQCGGSKLTMSHQPIGLTKFDQNITWVKWTMSCSSVIVLTPQDTKNQAAVDRLIGVLRKRKLTNVQEHNWIKVTNWKQIAESMVSDNIQFFLQDWYIYRVRWLFSNRLLISLDGIPWNYSVLTIFYYLLSPIRICLSFISYRTYSLCHTNVTPTSTFCTAWFELGHL